MRAYLRFECVSKRLELVPHDNVTFLYAHFVHISIRYFFFSHFFSLTQSASTYLTFFCFYGWTKRTKQKMANVKIKHSAVCKHFDILFATWIIYIFAPKRRYICHHFEMILKSLWESQNNTIFISQLIRNININGKLKLNSFQLKEWCEKENK